MSKRWIQFFKYCTRKWIKYCCAIQNANNIQKYLATPEADRNSLDGLDAAIAALSFAATSAAMGASVANAGLSGSANAAGAMLTGAAYH